MRKPVKAGVVLVRGLGVKEERVQTGVGYTGNGGEGLENMRVTFLLLW